MNVIKLFLSTTLALSPLSLAFADSHGDDGAKLDANAVAATVNGKPVAKVTAERVAQQIAARGEQADPNRILEELINLEILTQEAEKLNLDKEQDVATALNLQYTQTMANAYLAHFSGNFDVSDEEIRAEYDRQTSQTTSDEYNAAHILLESEDEAKNVIDELDKGADFAKLAKEKSTGPSGPNGGELGWFQAANMVPEFANAVSDMKAGETSTAPVKTQFGWHVIQLNETRGSPKPDLDSVRPSIMNALLRVKLAEHVEALRSAADITIK